MSSLSFVKSNPSIPQPAPSDLAVTFFQTVFRMKTPANSYHPSPDTGADGKAVTVIKPVSTGGDIPVDLFDMWRLDHAERQPAKYSGDMVTTVRLRPRPGYHDAECRVSARPGFFKMGCRPEESPVEIRKEVEIFWRRIHSLLLMAWAGEMMVNVLQVNLDLRNQYGTPQ